MAKPEKMNFRGRPDLACSTDQLRPTMNNIFIDEGSMIATNGHFLVKIPLEFSNLYGDTTMLNNYYIHPAQYREMLRYQILMVTDKGEITAKKAKTDYSTIFKLRHQSNVGVFPDYRKVMDFEDNGMGYVGLNSGTLKKFISCFDGLEGVGNMKMKIQKPSKAIHFESESNEGVFGLIMPVMLSDSWGQYRKEASNV